MPLGEKENVLLLKSLPIYVGWLLYTKIPGKFPGISYFSGNFPGSREAQNPGKMEPLLQHCPFMKDPLTFRRFGATILLTFKNTLT